MPAPKTLDIYGLVKSANIIIPLELDDAQKIATHLNLPLYEVLIGKKLISKEEMGSIIARSLLVEYVNLTKTPIPKQILQIINESLAQERKIVAFNLVDQTLQVAMEDPKDLDTINLLRKLTGLSIQPFFTFEKDIKFGLHQYKSTLTENFEKLLVQVTGKPNKATLRELAEDVSVVEAVQQMLEYAVIQGASDVHIEALADAVLVRYRIDGVLRDMITLPKTLQSAIVARIKIITSLKLDESRLPQDGRIQFKSDEGDIVSLRVSIMPTVNGEKVVLRVLDSGVPQFSLSDLGYNNVSVELIKTAITKPHGLILLTGPTGSGKTTSLYTMLNLLNTGEVNIATIEDPVEKHIYRVNQTQVNQSVEFGFAEGLRALLRQDPNIIMVGEIRDTETARNATNASMTGHLVLSTLHTNDAPNAIPRLIDLGAEPFLVASTLEIVIAQRLVRKNCPQCSQPLNPDMKKINYLTSISTGEEEKKTLLQLQNTPTQKGFGCDNCHFTGYSGRVGIYELFSVNDEIRELTLSKASARKIREAAIRNGMQPMLADGLKKVINGVTTVDEILRVTFA